MIMEESIKNIIKEFFQEANITEENKDFFRNSIITVLAERFQTRTQNDENLFGRIVDEFIEEKMNSVAKKR